MNLSELKYKVFIHGDCENICEKDDLDILSKYFEPFDFDDLKTFNTVISFEPTHQSITNRFYALNLNNENETRKIDGTPLSDFMTVEEIKTIDYFDYAGEHIHGIIHNEKSGKMDWIFEVSNPRDVILVAEKYKNYLIKQSSLNNLEAVLDELKGLIKIAEIAKKYNKELWFFSGYTWQY